MLNDILNIIICMRQCYNLLTLELFVLPLELFVYRPGSNTPGWETLVYTRLFMSKVINYNLIWNKNILKLDMTYFVGLV